MRTIIVGDVHGMLPELNDLLVTVRLTPEDLLVLCGDLLDKGPDSVGVVQYCRALRDEGQPIVLVKGNHEEKHERYRRALAKSGKQPDLKGVAEIAEINAGLTPADVRFLDTAVMFHRIPEHDSLVVHAGITPSLHDLSTASHGELAKLLRVRYITGRRKVTLTVEVSGEAEVEVGDTLELPASIVKVVKKSIREKGDFMQLGENTPEDPFWATVYDGRFGHVFFGHEPFTGNDVPESFPHATGLDLGCVFGGRLACAILAPGQQRQYASVKAHAAFCAERE